MIDLHTHSLLSDGELLPSELARRAKVKGYKVIGISDHVDVTNMEHIVASIMKLRHKLAYYDGITIVPGVEITHVPKGLIKEMIAYAKKLGIGYVVVHGETPAEPVEEGTNREAIDGGANILAHPGMITKEDVLRAKERGVLLEISARKGHSIGNGHVASLAKEMGARLIFNTDAHSPSDLVTEAEALRVVMGAGLSEDDFRIMQKNARELVQETLKEQK